MALSELACEPERMMPSSCEKHGDYVSKVIDLMGREIKTGCPVCLAEAQESQRASDALDAQNKRAAWRSKALEASGITPRFADKTLDNFRADTQAKLKALTACRGILESITEHKPSCPSLILCGKPGTGKSHLAAGIAVALIDVGHSVRKINASDLIRLVRDTWSRDSQLSEAEAYSRLADRALLIIDEVGVQNGTDNEKVIMFEVINRRYEACLPTILISNLSPEQIKLELGERVMDRLREDGGRMIAFDWASERRGAA